MKISEIFLKPLVLIFMGISIFYVDKTNVFSETGTKVTILLFVLFKTCFFMTQSYFKIREATEKHLPYYKFLVFMGYSITLLILSFAIDYFVLNEAVPNSFVGINYKDNAPMRFLDFIYFSSLNMTNSEP